MRCSRVPLYSPKWLPRGLVDPAGCLNKLGKFCSPRTLPYGSRLCNLLQTHGIRNRAEPGGRPVTERFS